MESLFWFAVFGSLFSYFIYPFTLVLLKRFYPSPLSASTSASQALQSVTFIVTAHNEAKQIKAKLDNTLELDRSGLEVQIIVASDFSTDGTDEIVESYSDQGVELVRADQHLGKEYAQLCGIRAATGEIIVFSDSATRLKPSALKTLLPYFSNPAVGALSSEDRFLSTNGTAPRLST